MSQSSGTNGGFQWPACLYCSGTKGMVSLPAALSATELWIARAGRDFWRYIGQANHFTDEEF